MCSSDFLTSSCPPLEILRTSSNKSSNVIPLHIFQSETAVSLTRYASPLPFIRRGVPSQSLPTTPLRKIILLLTLSLFNNIRSSSSSCSYATAAYLALLQHRCKNCQQVSARSKQASNTCLVCCL